MELVGEGCEGVVERWAQNGHKKHLLKASGPKVSSTLEARDGSCQ